MLRMIPTRKLENKPENKRNYLKITYLIMDFYTSTIYKDSLQLNTKKMTEFKNGQRT